MQTPDCWWRSMAAPLNGQGAAASKGGAHSTTTEPICPLSLSLSGLGVVGHAEWADVDGEYARCFFAGWLYKSQSRPSIPSIRHRADKAGTRQTRPLLHTHVFTCACAFFAPGEGLETCSMFQKETGRVIPPSSSRNQGDGRKRKGVLRPPSKSRRSPVSISAPKCGPPKADAAPYRPQAALSNLL
jgi:hypothetical protein